MVTCDSNCAALFYFFYAMVCYFAAQTCLTIIQWTILVKIHFVGVVYPSSASRPAMFVFLKEVFNQLNDEEQGIG